jgi:acetate kinase
VGLAVVSDGRSILVVNAGSTSLKLHLVDESDESRPLADLTAAEAASVRAVAHRVVHGGARFYAPVLIDERVAEQIFALEPLAPLHNAPALRAIERARAALPHAPHVAVFDTAFHRTMPIAASTYALPQAWRERFGVHRYGFHGLSLAWCAERVPQLLARSAEGQPSARPAEGLRLVVCHLGGGCSVSAVRDGCSLDTTMGFSPLEGVPMATRSGSVDPGALLYLIREQRLSVAEVEHALNFDSGLSGLAGERTQGEMRRVEALAEEGEQAARLAIEVFCHRVAGAVAAMAVAAGGLDALVFTAGIGESSARVRAGICERLAFLGVGLDEQRNRTVATAEPKPRRAPGAGAGGDADVSAPNTAVRVLVVEAREELVAARAARALLGTEGAQ